MQHFSQPFKWASILVLVMLVMTSVIGAGIISPAKVQACGNEGLTPGWWKNHTDLWPQYCYPWTPIGNLFPAASLYDLQNVTRLEALELKGGKGADGAARILLRAASAASLNVRSEYVDYPLYESQLQAMVNAALASGDRETMLALAEQLDAYNNLGVPGME